MGKINALVSDLLERYVTPGFFRFLLAFVVVVYHSVDFLTIGHYAVYVFFMLSGYWIFKMYDEKYRYFANPYWVYLTSRLSRLLPLYWLILIFSVIAYLSVPSIAAQLEALKVSAFSAAFFNIVILGLANQTYLFIGSAWSLDVEIQFYLLAPLLLFVCKRNLGIPLLVISVLTSIFLVYYHYEPVNLLVYLPYFIIGGGIYLFNIRAAAGYVVWGLFAVAAILTVNYMIPEIRTEYLLSRTKEVLGFSYREGLNVVLAVLTIPFVTVNVRSSAKPAHVGRDQLYSSMSYVIYLIHWPLLQLYATANKGVGIKEKFIYLVLYYIASVVLSFLIAKYIDQYFEYRRRKWLHNQQKKTILTQG